MEDASPSGQFRSLCEIAALLLTGGAIVLATSLGVPRYITDPACAAAWLIYVIASIAMDPSRTKRWGLRRDNLRAAALLGAPAFATMALALCLYNVLRGWRPLPPWVGMVLIVYPIWALVQQVLVQGIFVGNVRRMGAKGWAIVPVAAVLFGLAHAPEWRLVALVVPAAAVWTVIYLKRPNVLPLALAQGWLGTLAHFWVLRRHPFGL